MIDIAALEQALGPIEQLGKTELPVEAAGVRLVLRPMTPQEERQVQARARSALQDDQGQEKEDTTHTEVMEYLDNFKLGVLGYAIVQVDKIDLRGVPYVATGETTEEGVPLKKEKPLALRSILEAKFSRPMLLNIFKAYGDLMARIELESNESVVYEPVDLQTEINRLEERLSELQELKDDQETPPQDSISQQLKTATAQASMVKEAHQSLAEKETEVPEPEVPAEDRRSSIPASAPPPSRGEPEMPPDMPSPSQEAEPQDEPGDSFADPSKDALVAETRRILEARREAQRQRAATTKRRSPPHRQAANTEDVVLDTGAGSLRRAKPTASVAGDAETYEMPPTDLTPRGGGPRKADIQKAKINQGGDGGEVNSRFIPPGRR